MNIRIQSLELKNFKGIRHLKLEIGGNMDILGDNATGKTSVMDAVLWLLFDKNSENKSDFGIKTIVDGEPLHRVEHEVNAVLLVDDDGDHEFVRLRKVYSEVYKKTRGKLNEEFSGHTTDYWVNDVPVRPAVYKERIGKLVKEELFRLLTNPLYFQSMDWNKRRRIVLEVAGNMTDDEVIRSSPKLGRLTELLKKDMSVEDLKKMLQSRAKLINQEVAEIPIRIAELVGSVPEAVDIGRLPVLMDEQKVLQGKARSVMEEIAGIKASGRNPALENEAAELSRQIDDLKHAMNRKRKDAEAENTRVLDVSSSAVLEKESEVRGLIEGLDVARGYIARGEQLKNDLIAEFDRESVKQYELKAIERHCPYCDSLLPQVKLNEIAERIKAEQAEFNRAKSEVLGRINERGKANSEALQRERDRVVELERLKELRSAELEELKSGIPEVRVYEDAAVDVERIKALSAERERVVRLINAPSAAVEESVRLKEAALSAVNARIDGVNAEIAQVNSADNTRKRIAELEARECVLAKEYEGIVSDIYLCESFTRTKVAAIEGNINARFELARFRLFENNITNDGINECCRTMYLDVPYEDLNNAARINVGLDIIKALAKHYGVSAPIFVDNAEAVTQLLDVDDIQLIRLIVSEGYKKLTAINKN